MPHVITQACCNDAGCVAVCPVNCIHPTPDEPAYARTEMLYIDPGTCIDCGACTDVGVCPVDAIVPDTALTPASRHYERLNAQYYDHSSNREYQRIRSTRPRSDRKPRTDQVLRVAVVGSGPSACYAARELLRTPGLRVEVEIFERLRTPWGLIRHGVAPDHSNTKRASRMFEDLADMKGISFHFGVDVGSDITHAELLEHHHAVIYAVGAADDRRLGIDGEDLPGSVSATQVASWYNGHPDFADQEFDLTCETAVVLGNGNVALDVARILTLGVDDLRSTDIAEHALEALAESRLREVIVVGRRDPSNAAYTTPELIGLSQLPGTELAVEHEWSASGLPSSAASPKTQLAYELSNRRGSTARKRIVLRYCLSPVEIIGETRVEGVVLRRNRMLDNDSSGRPAFEPTDEIERLCCGLVVRAVGYLGRQLPGLPYDARNGTIPNVDGRVVDPGTGEPRSGVYVAGWIKRGPSGVIGTNKWCSIETVDRLIEDYVNGGLRPPAHDRESLLGLVRSRTGGSVGDLQSWRAIDRFEQRQGARQDRPRVKLVRRAEQLDVARGRIQ